MNLDLIRSFFAIIEHGSLNRAAERLGVSQSTLTRQMQALEHEVGGRLLERDTSGVALTSAGHALAAGMRPLLASVDQVIDRTRKLACGKSSLLRIGYLMSAAADYLHPALTQLRRAHPEVKVTLHDLSPGEQIRALRAGEIDLALIGHAGTFLNREFFVRRLASLPVLVALSEHHRLASAPSVRIADLKSEMFVGAPDRDMPGHNQWVVQLCRRAKFRPRFIQEAESLAHGLATIVTEDAVSLLPQYATRASVPGVTFRPLKDPFAHWDLVVSWQRGRAPEPLRFMLEFLGRK